MNALHYLAAWLLAGLATCFFNYLIHGPRDLREDDL